MNETKSESVVADQDEIRNSKSEIRNSLIVFDDVSKFYGEILGVNRVNLQIAPGITSLVGPNGAGKSTLMNLMTGLLRPSRGRITILDIPTDRPEQLFRKLGYCTQFDSFPRGLTGREFIKSFLLVHGFDRKKGGGADGYCFGTSQLAGRCRSKSCGLQQRHAAAYPAGPGNRASARGVDS